MECESALRLIEQIVFMPGWRFEAEDHTKRFEDAVMLTIHYPARSTARAEAPDDYPNEINTYARFVILAGDCDDDEMLWRCIMEKILLVLEHEAREYFRIRPTFWAPYHPHRREGMKRWGNPATDLGFGL